MDCTILYLKPNQKPNIKGKNKLCRHERRVTSYLGGAEVEKGTGKVFGLPFGFSFRFSI